LIQTAKTWGSVWSDGSRPLRGFLELLASRPHIVAALLLEHRSPPLGQLLAIRIRNHRRPTTPQHLMIELHVISQEALSRTRLKNI